MCDHRSNQLSRHILVIHCHSVYCNRLYRYRGLGRIQVLSGCFSMTLGRRGVFWDLGDASMAEELGLQKFAERCRLFGHNGRWQLKTRMLRSRTRDNEIECRQVKYFSCGTRPRLWSIHMVIRRTNGRNRKRVVRGLGKIRFLGKCY